MHLATYKYLGENRIGSLWDQQIIDLNRSYRAAVKAKNDLDELAVATERVPADMIGLLRGGAESLQAAEKAAQFVQELSKTRGENLVKQGLLVPIADAELLAPVLNPRKVVCLGLNYRAHAAEGHWDPPEYPVLFHKTAGALIGRDQAIRIPRVSDQIDYEGELAIIIGKRGKYIDEANALDYVAGYSIANDVSARDLQFRTRQWTTGKMLDTFCPLGPALVTRDEVSAPNNLRIKTTLNEMVVQNANTSEMIFSVPFIIHYISSLTTLEPGDVILTGTPEGIGNAREPKLFMKAGDTVTVEIEGLGVLSNRVEKE